MIVSVGAVLVVRLKTRRALSIENVREGEASGSWKKLG
jgi:hypothetical protein